MILQRSSIVKQDDVSRQRMEVSSWNKGAMIERWTEYISDLFDGV